VSSYEANLGEKSGPRCRDRRLTSQGAKSLEGQKKKVRKTNSSRDKGGRGTTAGGKCGPLPISGYGHYRRNGENRALKNGEDEKLGRKREKIQKKKGAARRTDQGGKKRGTSSGGGKRTKISGRQQSKKDKSESNVEEG